MKHDLLPPLTSDPDPTRVSHADEPARTLSDYHASPSSRRLAFALVAVSLGMFLALVPFAREPLPMAPWFITVHQPILCINDILTATMLFGYFRQSRQWAILILGCGYLYSAVMSVVHMLSFPDAFVPGGLLGGGSQTTGYLHVFWHLGFPAACIAYSYLKEGDRKVRHVRRDIGLAVGATLAAAVVLSVIAIAGSGWLPQMLHDGHYSSAFNVGRFGQWAVTAVALAILFTRRSPSTLDLWLMVVLSAWFFEIGLVSIFNAGRWDVGFYAGRFYGLVASSFVLIMLLIEQGRMYRDLSTAEATARTAADLQRTREVLRVALEAGRMGVFNWDLRTGEAWWSPELERMVGLPPGALAPRPEAFAEYVLPEDQALLDEQIRVCLKGTAQCEVEFRLRRPGGEIRWASARGAPTQGEDGRAVSIVGAVVDITDRKRNEEAASEMDAHFRTLADELPEIAWMARPDGSIYWYNRRWYDFTGLTVEESLGWGWQKVQDPVMLPIVVEKWTHSVVTGEPYDVVMPIRRKDGQYRQFVIRAIPIRDAEGRIMHWFGTNTDVTVQTEAERKLKLADQRKDEFLATLAHELRNPLAPIRNAAELLARVQVPPHVERALAIIDRQSRHLARLVDDLLEVSRITQGKVSLQKSEVSLVDCLSDALHAVEAALAAAGHEMSVHFDDHPLFASADGTRIVQCFLNLLNNAIKFTPRGGRIAVAARHVEGRAEISVSDNGIGIPAESLDGIFGLFAQVTPALERSQGGLGIGLALVKGFVELHGGTVRAESTGAGQGSTFTITLPLLEARPSLPDQPQVTREALLHPRRVLVIDDNVDAAGSMVELLRASGHQVREAHNGPDGLDAAFEFEPEVVLLDVGMPGMTGLDVARELRRRVGMHTTPRIIAVTGWGQKKDRELTREAGFDFHLTKPVNHTDLDVLLTLDMPPPSHAAQERPVMRH